MCINVYSDQIVPLGYFGKCQNQSKNQVQGPLCHLEVGAGDALGQLLEQLDHHHDKMERVFKGGVKISDRILN